MIKLYVAQQRYSVSINMMWAISEKHINIYAFNKMGFKIMWEISLMLSLMHNNRLRKVISREHTE